MMNRIIFADNPWPNGHAIKELEWSARIDPETGLWFDLHLVSDDYYAEDDDSEDDDDSDDDEDIGDWESKIVWNNYHSCILSSTYWGHAGFLVATENEPLDFTTLAARKFALDPLPPPEDPFDRAFGIYLLGHDGAADHQIQFTPLTDNKYELDWSGKIAMEYVGSDTFDHTFHARFDQLTFTGIRFPEGTEESNALALLERFATNVGAMKPEKRDHVLWLVPA